MQAVQKYLKCLEKCIKFPEISQSLSSSYFHFEFYKNVKSSTFGWICSENTKMIYWITKHTTPKLHSPPCIYILVLLKTLQVEKFMLNKKAHDVDTWVTPVCSHASHSSENVAHKLDQNLQFKNLDLTVSLNAKKKKSCVRTELIQHLLTSRNSECEQDFFFIAWYLTNSLEEYIFSMWNSLSCYKFHRKMELCTSLLDLNYKCALNQP